MASVTIDASVLAIPPKEATSEEVRDYVENLLKWKRFSGQNWVDIVSSENLYEVLEKESCLPDDPGLKELFNLKGLGNLYSPNDILSFIRRLLNSDSGLQSQFNLRYVLLAHMATIPNIFKDYSQARLLEEFKQSLVLCMLLRCHCTNPVKDHLLIVKPWEGKTLIQVQAQIEEIEHSRTDLKNFGTTSNFFEGEIEVCQKPEELIACLDEVALWRGASNAIDKEKAFKIALYKSQLNRGMEPEWEEDPFFSFGSNFLKSAESCCKSGPESLVKGLLRAMAETVDGIDMKDTHQLRTSNSGNSPQRIRGRDKARGWRRDIDYEYHLHYWAGASGKIEFADVVVHNDFSITE